MSRFSPAVGKVLVYVLLLAYFILLLVIDDVYWQGGSISIIYAVAIVLVALLEPGWFVGLTVATALLFSLVQAITQGIPSYPWIVTLAALAGVGVLSVLVALDREKAQDRQRERQEMIVIIQDLRQPLTVIMGRTQRLARFENLPSNVLESLKIIEDSARGLDKLVQKLLSYRSTR